MFPEPTRLVGSYDYRLVVLSVVIATFASYAALDLAGRVTVTRGPARFAWLGGGASAMGLGIWSMHYIGMLAFRLPIPVWYNWPIVLLSLSAAILASVAALHVTSRRAMSLRRTLSGSIAMGGGIGAMHYIGMHAMRMGAVCHLDPIVVVLSVILAVLISFVALRLVFLARNDSKTRHRRKIASAIVMGAAIPIMHYTGMSAASFTVSDQAPDLSHAVGVSTLGVMGIAAVTITVLGIATLTAAHNRLAREASTLRTRALSARIRALRAAMTTFCLMIGFEVAKQAVQPKVSTWTSHAETILFTTLLATVLCFTALRKEEQLRFELAWSETQYRLLFDSNPLPTWVFARNTLEFLAVNEAAIRHYGFSRREFLAMTTADIRPEEDVSALSAATAQGVPKFEEAKPSRHRKKDGTIIDVEVVRHQLDFEGTEAELVTSHDVSERKRAERTTNLLAAIVDSSEDAIISKSLDGTIKSWNKAAERVFGYSPETAIGQHITLIVPPDRRNDEAAILERLKRGEPIEHFETVRVRKDGTLVDVALTISPVKDSLGRVVGASKVARDITERKHTEISLRQAEEKYRAIFEDAVVGIFQITPEGRPLSINRALAEMHGYDFPEQLLSEVSNLPQQLFVDPSRMDTLREVLAEKGAVRGAEVEIYRRDRSKKWVLANMRAVREADGKIVLLEGTVEDITDRKVAEERVQFLAYYDALTGLPNRTLLQDRLPYRARRGSSAKGQNCTSVPRSRPLQDRQRFARALGRRPASASRSPNGLSDGPVNKTPWRGWAAMNSSS